MNNTVFTKCPRALQDANKKSPVSLSGMSRRERQRHYSWHIWLKKGVLVFSPSEYPDEICPDYWVAGKTDIPMSVREVVWGWDYDSRSFLENGHPPQKNDVKLVGEKFEMSGDAYLETPSPGNVAPGATFEFESPSLEGLRSLWTEYKDVRQVYEDGSPRRVVNAINVTVFFGNLELFGGVGALMNKSMDSSYAAAQKVRSAVSYPQDGVYLDNYGGKGFLTAE